MSFVTRRCLKTSDRVFGSATAPGCKAPATSHIGNMGRSGNAADGSIPPKRRPERSFETASRLLGHINPVRFFRQSLIRRYTLLFSVITLLLLAGLLVLLYHRSIGNLENQQQRDIELQSMQQQKLAASMSRKEYIELLNHGNQSGGPVLTALENTDDVLSFIPENLSICPVLSSFPVWNDAGGHIQNQQGCVTKTRHGTLLVSLDSTPLEKIRKQFFSALALVGGAAILLSVLLGWLFSNRVLKRLKEINQLCAAMSPGRTETEFRLPVSRRCDEFDTTAEHINRMLDAVDRAVEQIAGVTDTIAHDLRTPLSRLRIRLETLINRKAPVSCDELEGALAELDSVLSAFRAMLTLTRLERRPRVLLETVDLSKIAADALELAAPLFETEQQVLKTNIAHKCIVPGDADLLFRLCFNLLENAGKYAGTGATVEVELTQESLSVRDTGPGIPESERDKVLQRFYRADDSRSIPGYGLGLSFVREICRLHRMELLLCDNSPGLNVTVRFKVRDEPKSVVGAEADVRVQ
jgi:signal transduction histidine kinase